MQDYDGYLARHLLRFLLENSKHEHFSLENTTERKLSMQKS